MNPLTRRLVCLALVCLFGNGCQNAANPSGSLTGTWVGTVSTFTGSAEVRLTLIHEDAALTGTWATRFAYPDQNAGGQAAGRVSGSDVVITLTPGDPAVCPYQVTATVTGNTINGIYTNGSLAGITPQTFDCSLAVGGAVFLVR